MNSPAVSWVEVASLGELWEGDLLEVTAEQDNVLLVHLPGGELRAYQARCPHQGYPLTLVKWMARCSPAPLTTGSSISAPETVSTRAIAGSTTIRSTTNTTEFRLGFRKMANVTITDAGDEQPQPERGAK
jgi:nitrite reductase/ring-hydroxylating ferredoxin subunit